MTSVSQQPVIPSQNPSIASQSTAPAQSPSSASRTSSPQAATAGRSYASATKKTAATIGPSPSASAGGAAHGKSDSASLSNGKSLISPAVPALSGPTIVNGNNAINSSPYHSDHSRKSSVTISAAGTSGQMPNGGPVAGKPAAGNGIQFGSMNSNANASPGVASSTPNVVQNSSLAVSSPSNPRITSPATSPSPIPNPPASGGRPPSSLHGQGTGLSFGSMGGDDPSRQHRIGSVGSLTPNMQAAHLRRDSSQSSHADIGNGGMGPNGGRGGYPQHGGRGGRGGYNHPQHYQQQQMQFSPNNSFRSIPNAPRGGQGMSSPYPQGARPVGPSYSNSPHQGTRSPSLANSQPLHPQPGQMPMQGHQMPPQPYFNPQIPQHQVKPQFSSAISHSDRSVSHDAPLSSSAFSIQDSTPVTDQVGQFLMKQQQGQYMGQHAYDPNYGYYHPQFIQPGMPMGQPFVPQSPRPPFQNPQGSQQQYMPGQYDQAQPMSRTPSGVPDRPASTVGPPQPPMTPAASHQPSASRGANSPAPKPVFQIPVRKTGGIVIKDPNSGAVKTFDKSSASPAPSKSPANSTAAATPPPPTAAKTPVPVESQHTRTDSQAGKSSTDKAKEMAAAVRQKIKDDEEKELLSKEQQDTAEPKKAEALAPKETEKEPETKDKDMPKKSVATEEPKAARPQEAAAAPSVAAAEPEKPEEPEVDEDSDEYWARIEAEEERKEKEREEAYQKKKAIENAVKAKKEAEDAIRRDAELKKAEDEAEAIELARMNKTEETEGDKDGHKLFAELKKSDNAFQATKSSSAADTPGGSGASTPNHDTSSMGPPARAPVGKQKPAALKLETTKQVEPPQPSAALQSLRSARFLSSIGGSLYPAAIASPNPALNSAAPMGKFRYDKDFLMQFQKVFVEKPSETWSDKVKETVGDTSETPSSARPGRGGALTAGRQDSKRGSVLPGSGFGGSGGFGAFTQPGGGRTLPPNTTSEQRYLASISSSGAAAGGKPASTIRYNPGQGPGFPMGFGPSMSRQGSTSSMGQPHSPRNNPSRRGDGRSSKGGKRENDKDSKTMPLTAGMDLKPIQRSETGWKPISLVNPGATGPLPGGDGYLAPDVVQRKVKSALNKMTPSTFEKISGQILDIVAQSQKETDGRTLRQVIGLTFEKATDEAHWAQMYAEWCGKMLTTVQSMQPEIRDETLPLDKNGKVNSGGTLFRKYLLNRCQQDFEAGWKAKLPDKPEGDSAEIKMLSDEYYIAEAAKRRGLGLVRFIGELYKLGMLTSRIMHMCVKRLVDFDGMPDEAEVESLTSLLKTIGESLDGEEKARPSIDAYFDRIKNMITVEGLPSRLKFMLMDIVDLRSKGWKSKDTAAKGPATLEEIRAQAAAAERAKEAQRAADNSRGRGGGGGGSRMNMGRGDARNFSGGGGQFMPPPTNTVGMDDLRRLGKGGSRQASSQGTASFGPPSMFNTRGSNPQRRSMAPGILGRGGEDSGASSRTATPPAQREKKEKEEREAATSANAYSALAALDSNEANDHPGSPPSAASSPPVSKARAVPEQSKSPANDKPEA